MCFLPFCISSIVICIKTANIGFRSLKQPKMMVVMIG
nr:MAG TPA: hypothetical protein [Caudoviricetes sp.]